MNLNSNAVETCSNILECMMVEEIRHTMHVDGHLNALTTYVINGWQSTRGKVKEEIQVYWPFCNDMLVIDGTVVKGQIIVILASL